MRRLLLPLVLLLSLVLAACTQPAAPADPTAEPAAPTEAPAEEPAVEPTEAPAEEPEPTEAPAEEPEPTEEPVVEETEEPVVEETEEPVVEETEEPVVEETPKVMVICMAQEPTSLIWQQSALVTSAIWEAVWPPLVDSGQYSYQATLIEKLPSVDDGDATLEEVTVAEGDRIYDVASDAVLTLTSGMTETFSLAQLEGDPVVVEGYAGEELTTVQQTATFTLVEGLVWDDGSPVTSDDQVYNFEVNLDPADTRPKYVAERTASYEATDELTTVWTGLPGYTDGTYFLNVWQPLPRYAYGDMAVAELMEDDTANRMPPGYGPFRLVSWDAGQAITVERNPNWTQNEPPLSEIIFRFVPDTNNLVAQLASGECDLGTQDGAFEGSLPLVRSFEEQGLMELLEVSGTTYEHMDFNLNPVEGYTGASATLTDAEGGLLFQNVDFRRAIAHCVDRQAVVDGATNGGGFVQHTYTAADHPLYPGDDAITIYEFDPAAGLELLAGLGWTDTDGDGILDKDGVTLTFEHSTRQNPMRELVTQIVQAQLLENCQIETEIALVGSEFFNDGPDGPVFGRRFDLAEFAWLTGTEPPCNLYQGSQVPTEEGGWSGQNNTGWANAEFDAACNTAIQTLDPEVKATAHAEAMAIFTDELPIIPLFARAKIAVQRPGVTGVIMDPTINSELFNVENFDLTTE